MDNAAQLHGAGKNRAYITNGHTLNRSIRINVVHNIIEIQAASAGFVIWVLRLILFLEVFQLAVFGKIHAAAL